MFIKKITIENFRLFESEKIFEIDDLNIPNKKDDGSGLNVFVGENGSGKSALLEAFVLPILEYKKDNISIKDFNDLEKNIDINIYSGEVFDVDGTMPKSFFKAKGFSFEAKMRTLGSKSYLSTLVVSDQQFISNDPFKPKKGSPDLRISVFNPFKGKRFDENDILFLDKNRIFQTRSGTYNSTRFDRLMEDFDHQYSKKPPIDNLNKDLDDKIKKGKIENEFLEKAIKKFKEISGNDVRLDFLNNCEPFKNAFFAINKDNNQQILLGDLGSGYEMIFAILYSFYLAQQSGKELIILLDEPELHLHPLLQEKFINFILDFSKNVQVVIATHSPLLVKQISYNKLAKVNIIRKGEKVKDMGERMLPYISANETNFLAFNLATEEYHNELFEELKYINGDNKTIKDFDNDFFVSSKGEPQNSPYFNIPNQVSEHTFIRNQIHHQKDNGKTEYEDLKKSIIKMRSFF